MVDNRGVRRTKALRLLAQINGETAPPFLKMLRDRAPPGEQVGYF